MDGTEPRVLGAYTILEELGRGSMGVVYRAVHANLNRTVALKVLRRFEADEAALAGRFHREAQAAARLSHPNIVAVHDAGEIDGRSYIAMDFVDGPTLAAVRHSGHKPRRWMLATLVQVARAVHYAHEHGVIHRDLKPSNILIAADGTPRVMDFSLALIVGSADALTRTGTAVGTPFYMAPEQVHGHHHDIDARTDVYALGVMLYELLTGRVPYRDTSLVAVYQRILEGDPEPPRSVSPSVSADLEAVCLKAMSADRAARYASAAEFADDLERAAGGAATLVRPTGPARAIARRIRHHPRIAAALVLTVLASALLAGLALRGRHLDSSARRLEQEGDELAGRGRWAQAVAAYTEALAKRDTERLRRKRDAAIAQAQKPPASPADSEAEAAWADGLARAGADELAEAERLLARAARAIPAAAAELELVRFERAAYEALEITAEGDDRSRLWTIYAAAARTRVAAALEADGPRRERLRLVARALEGDPPDGAAEWEDLLIAALARRGDAPAEAWCDRLVADRPDDVRALVLRALLRHNRGGADARADLERALARSPTSTRALRLRGSIRYGAGELAAALDDIDRALALDPADWIAHGWRGLIRVQQKDTAGAEAAYARAVELQPSAAHLQNNLGAMRLALGRIAEARLPLERARELCPTYATVWRNLGAADVTENLLEEALRKLDRAIELDPSAADSYRNRGLVRARRNEWSGAAEDYERALALMPADSPDRPAVAALLAEARAGK